MTIYEAIGGSFVIFTSCVGVYTLGRLVVEGLKRVGTRIEIGASCEEAAVRDYQHSS